MNAIHINEMSPEQKTISDRIKEIYIEYKSKPSQELKKELLYLLKINSKFPSVYAPPAPVLSIKECNKIKNKMNDEGYEE